MSSPRPPAVRSALAAARREPSGFARSHALAILVPGLPQGKRRAVLQEALAAATTIGDRHRRIEALRQLTPALARVRRAVELLWAQRLVASAGWPEQPWPVELLWVEDLKASAYWPEQPRPMGPSQSASCTDRQGQLKTAPDISRPLPKVALGAALGGIGLVVFMGILTAREQGAWPGDLRHRETWEGMYLVVVELWAVFVALLATTSLAGIADLLPLAGIDVVELALLAGFGPIALVPILGLTAVGTLVAFGVFDALAEPGPEIPKVVRPWIARQTGFVGRLALLNLFTGLALIAGLISSVGKCLVAIWDSYY